MGLEQIKAEISRMALSDQLSLVEGIWDKIAESNQDIPLPKWQQKALDERYQAYQANKLTLHDWQSVHEALRHKSS